jgi:hypothetical protein
MANRTNVRTFTDFWPRYLRSHGSRASQAFHLAGLLLSIALAVALISCGMVFFLVLAVVPAQIGAAIGHKLSPRRDRTVEDHPDWAAVADIRMCALLVTGRLGRQIAALSEPPSVPSTPGLAAG